MKPRITPKGPDSYAVSYRGHTGSIQRSGSGWTVGHFRPDELAGLCSPRKRCTADALAWLTGRIDAIEDPLAALVTLSKARQAGVEAKLADIHPDAPAALNRAQQDLTGPDSESACTRVAALLKIARLRLKSIKCVEHAVGTGRTSHIVDVTPKVAIEVHGRTYFVGDRAEYGSYNLNYIGTIVSIGAKTVTIEPRSGKRRRLDISTFAWRNVNTVAEKIATNDIERRCI